VAGGGATLYEYACISPARRLCWDRHCSPPASMPQARARSRTPVKARGADHRETFVSTRKAVINRLKKEGISASVASELADQWLIQGDFLLEKQNSRFDFVVGNPPYVRQELIPAPLLAEYRRRYQTMYDRADLYIPFIERSLSLLTEGGMLGFICADRWMKNRYGGPLREFIASRSRLNQGRPTKANEQALPLEKIWTDSSP
jgi:hypothetical protein